MICLGTIEEVDFTATKQPRVATTVEPCSKLKSRLIVESDDEQQDQSAIEALNALATTAEEGEQFNNAPAHLSSELRDFVDGDATSDDEDFVGSDHHSDSSTSDEDEGDASEAEENIEVRTVRQQRSKLTSAAGRC